MKENRRQNCTVLWSENQTTTNRIFFSYIESHSVSVIVPKPQESGTGNEGSKGTLSADMFSNKLRLNERWKPPRIPPYSFYSCFPQPFSFQEAL